MYYSKDQDNFGLAGFKKATDLKRKHPHLKVGEKTPLVIIYKSFQVTLAIGGWNEGSERYSLMAKDPTKRATFVKVNQMLCFPGYNTFFLYDSRLSLSLAC